MKNYMEKYADEEQVEKTITIRLPKSVFEKTALAAEWRKMTLEQSIEYDLFVLASHQVNNLSKLLEERKGRSIALNGTA
jgi:hypothetical protein